MKFSVLLVALLGASVGRSASERDSGPDRSAPVNMQPFQVLGGGIDIKVIYDPYDRVREIDVIRVVPGSGAARAGIKNGMRIIKIQSMPVFEVSKEVFFSDVLQQPVQDAYVFTVADPSKTVREVRIPISAATEKKKPRR